jgi:hypothetical protein
VALAGRSASRRIVMVTHCYSLTSLVQRSGDDDVEPSLFFMPFMPHAVSFVSVISLM